MDAKARRADDGGPAAALSRHEEYEAARVARAGFPGPRPVPAPAPALGRLT
jgi:hypothetical protein